MEYVSAEFGWMVGQQLLQWLSIVTACYFGARLVSVFERRSRAHSAQRTLRDRVRELEELTEALEAQVQQLKEADRFAAALRLRPVSDLATKADRVESR
jgi:hypothetical protein